MLHPGDGADSVATFVSNVVVARGGAGTKKMDKKE